MAAWLRYSRAAAGSCEACLLIIELQQCDFVCAGLVSSSGSGGFFSKMPSAGAVEFSSCIMVRLSNHECELQRVGEATHSKIFWAAVPTSGINRSRQVHHHVLFSGMHLFSCNSTTLGIYRRSLIAVRR